MGPVAKQFNDRYVQARAIRTSSALNSGAEAELGRFLAGLAARHTDRDLVFALRLAETGMTVLQGASVTVPTVAVIGPTQTGKSTVVNLIAGGRFVETSPLAAHTRRAGLLAVNTPSEGVTMGVEGDLRVVPRTVESDCPSCLIWDTPDFDSNAADEYRDQVARVCALADLIVVVLTKEKYADQSVWRVLETLAPLRTPTVICLNKCDVDAKVLLPVLRRRLKEHPVVPAETPVVPLPRLAMDDHAAAAANDDVAAFRRVVFEHLSRRPIPARRGGLARLMERDWAVWTAPVEQELSWHRDWTSLVAAHTAAFLERYRSEYIDHTRHHDVAQKAILGLLELLEIPALAGPMSRTRRALTWPFRKLAGSFGRPVGRDQDQELVVLEAAIEHYMLSLRSEALGHRGSWWRAVAGLLSEREKGLRGDFRQSIDAYREAFQPRIDALSRELYEQLKHNPLTLNALRATRVSADAGGIVLAIKTGTLGLYDALFAPAVVSLTSYLTESAVGQYLRTVIARLKREQVEQVGAIIETRIAQPLYALYPDGPGLFGITRDELDRASRHMEALRQ